MQATHSIICFYLLLLFEFVSSISHCCSNGVQHNIVQPFAVSSLRLSPFYHSEPKWISFIFILLFVRRFFFASSSSFLYSFSLPYIYSRAITIDSVREFTAVDYPCPCHGEKEKKIHSTESAANNNNGHDCRCSKVFSAHLRFYPSKRMKERNCDAMAWNGIERRNGKGKEEIVYFFYTIKMSERRTAE